MQAAVEARATTARFVQGPAFGCVARRSRAGARVQPAHDPRQRRKRPGAMGRRFSSGGPTTDGGGSFAAFRSRQKGGAFCRGAGGSAPAANKSAKVAGVTRACGRVGVPAGRSASVTAPAILACLSSGIRGGAISISVADAPRGAAYGFRRSSADEICPVRRAHPGWSRANLARAGRENGFHPVRKPIPFC